MKKSKKATEGKRKIAVVSAIVGALLVVAILAAVVIVNMNDDKKSTEKATSSPATSQTPTQAAPTDKSCVSDECLAVDGLEYPAGKLPKDVAAAVRLALDDEYKAYSVYDAVIDKLGSVRPFSMIIRAEESHIASLKAILDKYGEQVPANPYIGKVTVKATKQENCQIGVDAEIANVALYRDNLLGKVAAYPDITSVFTSLMDASNDKHLPAFQKCN